MDRIFVEGLELYAVIGLQEWERQVQQKLRIDLDIQTDCRSAGASDDVDETLDYRAAAKRVQQLVADSSYHLVESLAERIAGVILAEFPRALAVRVRVAKPGAVRFAETVGVDIERHREG